MKATKSQALFYCCLSISIPAFVYILLRAVHVGFVHDESLSYTILKGDPTWARTANNHLLSTGLSYFTSRIFGFSEFPLRLPNIASFILYAFSCYKLASDNVKHMAVSIACFCFLIYNQFLLEFFGLFRGYGLALSFFAGGLYCFTKIFHQYDRRRLLYGIALSILTIYANFAFLIPVLSMHLAFALRHGKSILKNPPFAIELAILFGFEAVSLAPAVYKISRLKKGGELYIGGHEGFFTDTFGSVLQYTFWDAFVSLEIIKWIFLALFLIALIFINNPKIRPILAIICLCAGISIILHLVSKVNYSTERSAIYWTVLMGAFFIQLLEICFDDIGRKISVVAAAGAFFLLAFSLVSFSKQVNVSSTTTWKYDANTRQALEDLDASRGKDGKVPVTLAIHWLFEPTINYYRDLNAYTWLNKVGRDGFLNKQCDYFYVFESNKHLLETSMEIRKYPLSESVLLRGKPEINP